ncbi:MAG: aldo/keto reductase [Rhodomicrobium sp.]|nr:aldo/keto reductase [Rhodomicrobium sp.]
MTSASPLSKTVALTSGETMPAFGIGTWRMGEARGKRSEEEAAIRLALDLGVTLIDTAEMYGEGGAEEIVGDAIAGRREELFIVSKVYPYNASRQGAVAACERSLKRLRTDYIDLYLLHWPGSIPIAETLEAFMTLKQAGKIRHYGVSNFDRGELEDAWDEPGGKEIAANQLLYNLVRRGIEWDTLPWMRERGMPCMAYSPLEQARLMNSRPLAAFAKDHGMTPAQAALRWLLARDDMIVIPKSSDPARLKENIAALNKTLPADQIAELDKLFPPPSGGRPLEML